MPRTAAATRRPPAFFPSGSQCLSPLSGPCPATLGWCRGSAPPLGSGVTAAPAADSRHLRLRCSLQWSVWCCPLPAMQPGMVNVVAPRPQQRSLSPLVMSSASSPLLPGQSARVPSPCHAARDGQRGVAAVRVREGGAQFWAGGAAQAHPLRAVQAAGHGQPQQEPPGAAAPAPLATLLSEPGYSLCLTLLGFAGWA